MTVKKMLMLCGLVLLLATEGCSMFTRTVYVPHGQAVRLREPVKKTDVWVKTPDGIEAGNMDIPEGWLCLPDPGE